MKKHVLILAFIALLFGSCAKETVYVEPEKSIGLVGTKWIITAQTDFIEPLGQPGHLEDVFASWTPCERDDVQSFAAGGIYLVEEGSSKCDPSNPQTVETGTWKLSEDKKTLTMTEQVSNITISFDVLQLDDKTMKLSFTYTFFNVKTTNTTTFAKVK